MSKMNVVYQNEPNVDFDWEKHEFGEDHYTPEERSLMDDLYDQSVSGISNINKDVESGEFLKLEELVSIHNHEIIFSNGVIDLPVDLDKEKRFLSIYGVNADEFIEWVKSDYGKEFLEDEQYVKIVDSRKMVTSLLKGFGYKLKQEFYEQIKNPTKAYTGKVISKNRGGYIVDVLGVEGFLPGSLAAANIVHNFDDFVGKEVNVMVEDYLTTMGMFVFSNKKYIQYIMPQKIKEIDFNSEYTGTITGIAKFGIFVEIEEIFTGLLHVKKMDQAFLDKFNNGYYKRGDKLGVYVQEVDKKNKLILNSLSPSEQKEMREIEREEKQNAAKSLLKVGDVYDGFVKSNKQFGSFVVASVGRSKIDGIVLNDYSKQSGRSVKLVYVDEKNGKFYFKFF